MSAIQIIKTRIITPVANKATMTAAAKTIAAAATTIAAATTTIAACKHNNNLTTYAGFIPGTNGGLLCGLTKKDCYLRI